ncbi:MAG: S53 family peptidase [Isosphaeraceae bacterium]|nr:S53 family peptidase [Isosphaeraceae bacterium]
MLRSRRRVLRPTVDCLDDRCLLSALPTTAGGLTPAQLKRAYGLDAVVFNVSGQTVQGDGTGQTIAIVDPYHDPGLASDLRTFDQAFGLPDPSLTQDDLAGSKTNDNWAGEEAMDVEWAHALAPGAKIVVVEARSDSTPNLVVAVNVARRLPGVSVVSMSWGGGELRNEKTYDRSFTTPAGHNGVTFVVSSGDAGARGGAQWPASSPNVLSVGGTTLSTDAAGNYVGETLWHDSSSGVSQIEPRPAYQSALQVKGKRSTPDVMFDGNPETGVAVYATTPSNGLGSWQVLGGTSLGAPAWGAIIAVADQGRSLAGLDSLDGATQTLPALYKLPPSAFHAVAGGRRGTAATGLGSPNGATLVHDLAFGS